MSGSTSTTQNTEGKRTYADAPKHSPGDTWTDEQGNSFEMTEKGERHLVSKGSERGTKVKNTAKPASAADLADNPADSPMVRASKRRQRMQRDAMRQK